MPMIAPKMLTGGRFTWFSRESLLLANNVILIAALATFGDEQLTVG